MWHVHPLAWKSGVAGVNSLITIMLYGLEGTISKISSPLRVCMYRQGNVPAFYRAPPTDHQYLPGAQLVRGNRGRTWPYSRCQPLPISHIYNDRTSSVLYSLSSGASWLRFLRVDVIICPAAIRSSKEESSASDAQLVYFFSRASLWSSSNDEASSEAEGLQMSEEPQSSMYIKSTRDFLMEHLDASRSHLSGILPTILMRSSYSATERISMSTECDDQLQQMCLAIFRQGRIQRSGFANG
ncbi:unnamed protein product [Clonostachys byssicola]|uniref:Uncharacterized protein n=1 Tax=Clonostachys byssicola TaxID=160290 RepID=A0A9N9U9S6_9HYPO|nr:unnamed protein product [Clonostachys byssicola]